MSGKFRAHIRSNIIGYIALFFALSTGSAVALNGSNTVFTDDIVDNQVFSADVRNDTLAGGGLGAADLRAGSVGSSEVADNSLTRADIANAAGDVGSDAVTADLLDGIDSRAFVRGYGTSEADNVTGRSSLQSNRVVLAPDNAAKHLFTNIPRLGELTAHCFDDHAEIRWRNTTPWIIDRWQEVNGSWSAGLVGPQGLARVAHSDSWPGGTLALGLGNDPGPRSIAIVHGFAFQGTNGAPCGLQAQATVWTIE